MEITEYQEMGTGKVFELWIKCRLVVPANNPQRDIERKLKIDRDLLKE